MCLNPVLRQPVCEKLYHKTGYERKKNCLRRRRKKKGRGERASERASTVSTDVFQLCDLSFVLPLFFLSLCLSRFNKASCRVWLSWEKKKRPSVAGAGAELGLAVRGGGRVRVGGAATSDQPLQPPVRCTVQSGGLAARRLFSALLSFHSFALFLSKPAFFLLSLTAPASVSLFPCWFPPCSPPPSLPLPTALPVVRPPPTIFFPPAALAGKLTASVGNDLLQTSAQWHHNKSRSSPRLSL